MISKLKNFETYFRAISYGVVLCGFLALFASGGLGPLAAGLFIFVFTGAWFLEDTRWQISERIGTAALFVVVPLFYIGWRYKLIGSDTSAPQIAAVLARMILLLAAIKLLQRKSDRDWLFLYLMAFFEVLLAAGMSISPLYLGTLILYLLVNICAIIAFEIRKTARLIDTKTTVQKNKTRVSKAREKSSKLKGRVFRRLPLTALALLFLIILFAAPIFFALPRTGGAGFGNNSKGLAGFTGFSESVELGSIGQLKQSDAIVMRVVLDESGVENGQTLRWRGVALDHFDNRIWSNSRAGYREPFVRAGSNFFRFDREARRIEDIGIQTIYLEPIDSPVLFSLARPFAAEQTSFQAILKDAEGNLTFPRTGFERVVYTIFSDRRLPADTVLRADNTEYSKEIQTLYLQLPAEYDERIKDLAAQLTQMEGNRFDRARALETYLQNNFGYTLEMKAGGEEPLADFLFRVRAGHCEYFATAMAVMLRTQGIAARIVNGFQQGEFNETAGVYVVRQKEAHSWVEVYFPEQDVWVPFDPTPFAGQFNESEANGFLGSVSQYFEALESLWIQYFVAFDNQEQRSLFRSVKNGLGDFQAETSVWLKIAEAQIADWWREVRGDKGLQASAVAIAYGIGYLLAAILGIWLIIWFYRKLKTMAVWKRLLEWFRRKNEATIIEFYERMQKVLASKGFVREPHQTPLEFAFDLKMPEAIKITEKYNRVRFGEKGLSVSEAKEIENWLKKLETTKSHEENTKKN